MSLPIYLYPLIRDIEDELELQGANYETIKTITYDFKGYKREEEFLKFLKENRNSVLKYKDLIAKKIELKEKYDIFWGYVLDEDNQSYYDPQRYLNENK